MIEYNRFTMRAGGGQGEKTEKSGEIILGGSQIWK
jgi:hypothetical protein